MSKLEIYVYATTFDGINSRPVLSVWQNDDLMTSRRINIDSADRLGQTHNLLIQRDPNWKMRAWRGWGGVGYVLENTNA
jgi:hypothetical protein